MFKVRELDGSDGVNISSQTISILEEKCHIDPEACYLLASINNRGQGVARDFKKGGKYAALACEKELANACLLEAEAIYFSADDKVELEKQYSRANNRACKLGLAEGCVLLFEFYYQQKRIDKSITDEIAIEYLDRACAMKRYDICIDLGRYYWEGRKPSFPKDKELAIKYLGDACDQDFGEGCGRLGLIYSSRVDNPRYDLKKAIAYYKKACRLRAGGCRDLSVYYRFGKVRYPDGPKIDLGLADKLEERSCIVVRLAYACFEVAKREFSKNPSKINLIIDYYLRGYQYGCEFGANNPDCIKAIIFVRDNTKKESDIEILRKYARTNAMPLSKLVCKKCGK